VGVLVRTGSPTATLLGVLTSVGLLLRARLFPTLAARLPLVAGGLVGLAVATSPWLADAAPAARLLAAVGGLVAAVALLASAASALRRRGGPSPYLTRLVEVLDVVAVVALPPTAFAVLGLYAWVRTLAG
jgi:hypothetical protein